LETNSSAQQAARIRQGLRDYRKVQVLTTFAELGIGDALRDGPATVAAVALACGCDERALRRFLDAAGALDIVEILDDGRVHLTQLGNDVMTSTGDASLVNLLRLEARFYQRWALLPEAVRIGGRPDAARAQEQDPEWVRLFTRALFDNARASADALASAVAPLIGDREDPHLIDVGGGHGAYSLALARRYPGLQATVFDLPPVIDVTREIISEAGMMGSVVARAGDFHHDPLGVDFDIALLFGVLHGETPENAARLIETIRDALRPSGHLLIRSQGQRDRTVEPGGRELADLHMLLSTEGGAVRRFLDTEQLLRDAGFAVLDPLPIPAPGSGELIVAQRPATNSGRKRR
jgi:SAM-dependent methyltransferase